MVRVERRSDDEMDHDAVGSIPLVGQTTSRLERTLGPSCLLSAIMTLLLILVVKRVLHISWLGMLILAILIWFGVLTLLLRWRSDRARDGR